MIIQVLWHIIIYSMANMFQESEGTYIKVRPQALFGGEPGGEEAYSYTHTHTMHAEPDHNFTIHNTHRVWLREINGL